MTRDCQTQLIRACKGLAGPASGSLPIFTREGTRAGCLVPLDIHNGRDPVIVDTLTGWRSRAMQYFFTRFTATAQRTAAWIERYLADDARLLFLIKTDTGRWEGHLGVCHVAGDTAEIDNTIRGERRGHPKLFYLAELALLQWAFGDLGVDSVYLRLFADNARAIALHDKVGFRSELRQKLIPRACGNDVHYEVDSHSPPGPQDASLVQMRVDRAGFLGRNPWLPAAGRSQVRTG